ncbi:MAG: hypothetical protein HFE60_07890 [Anaerotignum sp.]|jgi:hypothetical protein|nr:hypothetical protein [Anaerotignum sp.]
MTEEEKKEIVDELEKRLEEKYKLMLAKEHSGAVLREPREKWFNSPDRCAHNSIMANAFGGPFYSWQVWENVRKLTCQICGKRYVRELAGDKMAICERLCQIVFDLRESHEGRDKNV